MFQRFDEKPYLTPQDGVYFKGYVAGFKNRPKKNPYYDFLGQVTFRRSFERAWQRGYENGQKLKVRFRGVNRNGQ